MPLVLLAALALSLAGSLLATSIGRTRGVVTLARLGQGFLFGAIFAGFVANQFEKAGATAYVWPLALVVLGLAAFGAWREWLRFRHALATPVDRTVLGAMLVVAVIAILAAFETNDRPAFAWDAWTTWIYRAKAMFLVPGAVFAENPAIGQFEAAAAAYPNAIGGLLAWLARLAGEWSETDLLLLWPCAYLAVASIVLAVADAIAGRRAAAVLAMLLFATAPLVVTHAMLAGYMDLFVAGCVALLAALVARRAATVEPIDVPASPAWHATLRDLAVILLPFGVKREGMVWAMLAVLALVAVRWPKLAIGVVAAGLGVLLLGLVVLPNGLNVADWLILSKPLVRIPLLGDAVFMVNPILPSVRDAFFATQTFGIAMWTVAAALAMLPFVRDSAIDGRARRALRIYGALALVFVIALFAFTIAGAFAINQTSLSRIAMQVLPLALVVVLPVLERAFSRG